MPARRGLSALLGLALATGAVAIGSPARADDPVSYTLDSGAIWIGQAVRLTESGTVGEGVTRSVDWGDGTTEDGAKLQHKYLAEGSYHIAVTLTDGSGTATPGGLPAGDTVSVGPVPGSYGWQQPTIWTAPGYQNQGTLVAGGLPAGGRVWTGWGDGETSLLAPGATGRIGHWFGAGLWTPSVTLQNAQGRTTPRATDPLTVRNDVTAPWVTVTVPAGPHRAASWSTVRGKAGDSESGIDVVGVQLWKSNSSADYYYDFGSKKWVKYTGKTPPQTVQSLRAVDAAGNWSVPAPGLAKGWTLDVFYYAWDKVGNDSGDGADAVYALTS